MKPATETYIVKSTIKNNLSTKVSICIFIAECQRRDCSILFYLVCINILTALYYIQKDWL